jgi:hypothetical protein
MPPSSFIAYVGDPDFHDGAILSVEQHGRGVRVRVQGASGKVYAVDFSGVGAVRAHRSAGMTLYALSELRAEPPLRRFVFANWDDDGDAQLEVDAASFAVHEE